MRIVRIDARKLGIALILLTVSSCSNILQVKIDVVDQRTALENQVLGSYQEIGEEVYMLASVRSIDENGLLVPAPKISAGRRKALAAMQRSLFNKDDIEMYKAKGALGEGRDGYLKYFPREKMESDPAKKEFLINLAREENEDRKILYTRIVETNENFRDGDLPKVESIMAGLNRDSARKGELIEQDSGKWITKK
ncbi:hypothetical protein MNBD_NITROSPINAE02-1941 [hydrothermal vent metagenome]|uniref:DUF1318 domain-containing protein n=1 Tax=hydrothermal vent metagenome TaxID=652676 RepID=A0A3B1CJV2_9ZZZZ